MADLRPSPTAAERLQRAGAVLLLLGSAGLLGWRCATSPEITFLVPQEGAGWITESRPVDAAVQQYGQATVPRARFVRTFVLDEVPAASALRIEAARHFSARLNGAEVLGSDAAASWRTPRGGDVAAALRAGENRLEVEVWNPRGPPLLRARLSLRDEAVETDASWSVSVDGGASRPAARPDDTRLHASAPAGPSPGRALAKRWEILLVVFGLAWLAWAWWRERVSPEWLPWLVLTVAHGVWLGIGIGQFASIPLTTGFDATNHIVYVEHLRREGALPLPTAGWSTYHPPLFYAAVAALQEALAPAGASAERWGAKLPSFAAGLAQIWLAFGLARLLAPRRPGVSAAAVAFAAALPLNLYMGAYLSNEALHAACFGLAALLATRLLVAPRATLAGGAALGLALGLALLTKLTAAVVTAVAGFFVLVKVALVERAGPARLAALAAALAAPLLAVSGWFYVRNVVLYGTPVVGNWDLPDQQWWSWPGFHTPAYYLGFGESLQRPVLSGFHSFADALYSSFWGDGWIAGRASAALPPAHIDPDWMALGYWLAIPLSLLLVVGLARALRTALGRGAGAGPRAAWSFLLVLQFAMGYAMLSLTLQLPYFGQAKAPYLLGLVAPLAVVFALGVERADAWLGRLGAAAAGRALLTTACVVFWLSFTGRG
ncbi:MAG: glycosyltransferase family 39 protein [Myxococcota bacterium]|nr:glycosyltransferase family 39 protein [Myxococcota bacterium]